jgi:hypothetical protein
MTAIFAAEGIKGDGKRMSAALDLAGKSPSMSAEEVCAFVNSNVAAASATPDPAAAYEAGRLSAAGLSMPAPPPAPRAGSLNAGAIFAARRQIKKEV